MYIYKLEIFQLGTSSDDKASYFRIFSPKFLSA